jgi:signal transduction histidine kinase/ActR/RegA family two-component response regulator
MALSEVLRDLAEVVTATSGREALRHLLKGEFAVILLDVFMPGLDGYETASLIRERDQTARIPIIFLSAVNKETEHLMRGYAMGAVDYVFKPVDPMILKSKVSVFVDLYKMRVQVEQTGKAEQVLREANYKAELERLQIARELQETREREAAIIQSLPMLLYMEPQAADPRRPDFISGDMTAVTGFSFDQVQADPHLWEQRIHPDDRARVMAALSDRAASGRFSIEYRWQCADGSYKHFLDQAVMVKDGEGGITEFAGTLTDISEQRLLEGRLLQAQKMDAIGQLTGGIAHDFNNLLSAVLGGLHLLERRLPMQERDRLIVDQMRHAAEQGAELVRRMMAFARKQELMPASLDPRLLCTSVAGLVEHTLAGTIEIDWSCTNEIDNLFVDRAQLELALVNLILNARDAMPAGGKIKVEIDTLDSASSGATPDLPEGRYVLIKVSDEGEGIAGDIIDRITEPVFTTKESGKGTGLGLSMVAGFVHQSGGLLRIDSQSGQGTCVQLILPSTRQQASAETPKPLAPKALTSAKAVLLVDDDEAVRTVLGEQLREMGFAVDEAADGGSAIEKLKCNGGYDILLTDFAMPGMNGLDTIRSAVRQRPSIHALLMTGYADEDAVADARETVPVIRKPIDLDELMRRIA